MASRFDGPLTESSDELRAIAARSRSAAAAVRGLLEQANELSGPAYKTGWTRPISVLEDFGHHLESWGERLEELAAETATSTDAP